MLILINIFNCIFECTLKTDTKCHTVGTTSWCDFLYMFYIFVFSFFEESWPVQNMLGCWRVDVWFAKVFDWLQGGC